MAGRYDNLPKYDTTIRGRSYTLREVPVFPTLDEVNDQYVIFEQETPIEWDALAVAMGYDETDWWAFYILNRDDSADPLKPELRTVVFPQTQVVRTLVRSDEVS